MALPRKDVEVQTEQFAFSGNGEILSYTVVQEAPDGHDDQAPYVLALVKLAEGPVVTAQITDVDGPLQIGDPVEMVTRRLSTEGPRGVIIYGYKFRPVLPRQ